MKIRLMVSRFVRLITMIACLTTSAHASSDCEKWFISLNISPSDPGCDMKCATAETDMGSFGCPPEVCDKICKPKKYNSSPGKYIPPLGELCEQEVELIKSAPTEAFMIQEAQQAALEETKTGYGRNFRDDESDAFRHCFWSAMISTNLGTQKPDQDKAFKWLNAHESCSTDKVGTDMDNFNNRIGIQLSENLFQANTMNPTSLAEACAKAERDKRLKIIRPARRHI